MAYSTSASKPFAKLYATSALAVASIIFAPNTKADVVDGTFVSGSGNFSQSANTTDITVTSQNSIAEFNQYNIGVGQTVNYINGFSSTGNANHLSRVTGNNASEIRGAINSDRVNLWLINPIGVFFGSEATVNVPNIIVTASSITNDNFNKGAATGVYNFDSGNIAGATIRNDGQINVSETGLAALVAPNVINNGVIVANAGTVELGSGEKFTLDFYGDKLINFSTDHDVAGSVDNKGALKATGGKVLITAQAASNVIDNVINLDGIVEAKEVKVTGNKISLGGEITAKDGNNGGKITVHAKKTTVKKEAKLIADASVDGNGGDVGIFGDETLDFDGTVSAQGKGTGIGGFVETSGDAVNIGDDALVNTLDGNGDTAGTWLIDPTDITITSGFGPNKAGTIAAGLLVSNIHIDSTHDLTVDADITSVNVSNRTLTLNASNNLTVNSGKTIKGTIGKLNVNLYADNDINLNGTVKTNGGTFTADALTNPATSLSHAFNLGSAGVVNTVDLLTATSGAVNINAKSITLDGNINASALLSGNVNLTSDGSGDINVNGSINSISGVITINNVGSGNVTTGAASSLTAQKIAASAVDGNVHNNGTINAGNILQNGAVELTTSGNGNVTVDGAITATGLLGGLGSVKLKSANNNVNINKTITVGDLGSVDVQAANGSVNLGAAILSTPIDGLFTLTGNTNLVNVTSNDGIINEAVKIVNDNGTVHLADNTTFTQAVHINHSLTLEGGFNTVIAPAAMPLVDSTYNGLALPSIHGYLTSSLPIAPQPIVFVDGAANVTVQNLTVDGSGVTTILGGETGIGFYNSTGTIHNVTVQNIHDTIPTGAGIDVAGAASNVSIDGTTVQNYDLAGIEATDGATVNIDSSTINGGGSGLAQTGVLFNNAAKGSVKNSTISNNTGLLSAGVTVLNAGSAVEINGNNISGSDAGIAILGTNGVKADGNTIHGNLTGIISDSDSGIFTNNNISLALAGYVLNGGSDNLIQGGNINLTLDGIALLGTEDTIIDNVNIGANLIGISENNSTGTTVKNSSITLALDGIVSTDSADLTIDNTTLLGTLNGITLNNSDNATIKNSGVFASLNNGITANDSESLEVNNSMVIGSVNNGLELNDSDDAEVINSVFALNFGAGIQANSSDGLYIDPTIIALNGVGVELNDSDNTSIDSTIFLANFTDGVRANNSDNLTISNSVFVFNFDNGVEINDSSDANIATSFIGLNGNNGISLNNSSANVLLSLVAFNAQDGIHAKNGSTANVVLSAVTNNQDDGIESDSSTANVVLSAISGNSDNGIESNSGNANIVLSNIANNGNDGVNADDSNVYVILSDIHGNSRDGIHITNSDDVLVLLNNIHDNGRHGIFASNSDDLWVVLNNIHDNGSDGIHLNGSDSAKVILNTIHDNTGNGIFASNSDDLLVLLSDISTNGRNGIRLQNGSDNASVYLSNISSNSRNGIEAVDSDDLSVSASNIESNGMHGIRLFNADSASVESTDIHGNSRDGIRANSSTGLYVNNVNVYSNGRSGIVLRNGSDDAQIISSNVYDNTRDGIRANASTGLYVDSSDIYDNGRDGISLLNGADDAEIHDSNIYNNTRNGVYANASSGLLIDPTYIYGNNIGVNLVNSSNATIQDSYIYDNLSDGVFADSSDNLTITGTEITGNGGNGVNYMNGNGFSISSSLVDNNSSRGIYVDTSSNVTIDNTIVTNNIDDGVGFQNVTGATITDSDFSSNGSDGLEIYASADITVDNTQFTSNSDDGIDTNQSSNLQITDSTFTDNGDNGVEAYDMTDLLIDGSQFTNNFIGVYLYNSISATISNSTFTGGVNTDYSLFADGNAGPINLTMDNVTFDGTENNAAIRFQNATMMDNVLVSGVKLMSTAPSGWQFADITGSANSDVYETGDMDFNDTVFNNSYSFADIELINSTMDGTAENVTFIGDGGNPFNREARVIHDFDNAALGTIFYKGYLNVLLGSLFNELSNRTNIGQVYYYAASATGKAFDAPGLKAAKVVAFNNLNQFKVSLNSANNLNAIAPAAGSSAGDLANIEPAAGGNKLPGDCGTSFANSFLGDDVDLGSATGSCGNI